MRELTTEELRALAATPGPEPGQVYRHYKGGLYVVIARAIRESDSEPVVIYREVRDGITWSRPLADFTSEVNLPGVGGLVPRFRRVTV